MFFGMFAVGYLLWRRHRGDGSESNHVGKQHSDFDEVFHASALLLLQLVDNDTRKHVDEYTHRLPFSVVQRVIP